GGEVAALELGLAAAGQGPGARDVAELAAGAAAPVAPGQVALDADRPLRLDQLLGDRPRQRLEGLGAADGPDPRLAPDHRAEQGVAAEGALEREDVVIHPEREAHPLHGPRRRG